MFSLLEKLLSLISRVAVVHFLTESIAYFCGIFQRHEASPLLFLLLPNAGIYVLIGLRDFLILVK